MLLELFQGKNGKRRLFEPYKRAFSHDSCPLASLIRKVYASSRAHAPCHAQYLYHLFIVTRYVYVQYANVMKRRIATRTYPVMNAVATSSRVAGAQAPSADVDLLYGIKGSPFVGERLATAPHALQT